MSSGPSGPIFTFLIQFEFYPTKRSRFEIFFHQSSKRNQGIALQLSPTEDCVRDNPASVAGIREKSV
jgi:hypothetical protein